MARRTAEMAGGVPMMMHITDSPIPLPELLAQMKPGDIVTHCYHGRAHGIMGQEKQLILKEVVEALRHGIIFDCAHGRSHFGFPMIEKALDQVFLPDTISTDGKWPALPPSENRARTSGSSPSRDTRGRGDR
jgi:predicted amidohydrolase